MARNINGIQRNPPFIDAENTHQITAHMTRGAQQDRSRGATKVDIPVPQQRLLQLARLIQIFLRVGVVSRGYAAEPPTLPWRVCGAR